MDIDHTRHHITPGRIQHLFFFGVKATGRNAGNAVPGQNQVVGLKKIVLCEHVSVFDLHKNTSGFLC
ncbi:hypothetical protein SDC9_179045 [bioreactor metagenome]|uniref:Uncharacterized protein n=1 Tax=bioreactor metagenome TaxID=1076179 RepID=A0A645GXG7_9ZZZZ